MIGILGILDDVGEPAGQFVGGLSVGDVAGKASGVQEFVVTPQHVRIDLNEANRAVLTAQTRLVIQECLASRQTREDVFDDRRVDVELSDVVTDVLLTWITEQIELGLIGPQNRAVRPDEMQSLGSVIETRFQLAVNDLRNGRVTRGQCASQFNLRKRLFRHVL